MVDNLAFISANAIIPDQLVPYVKTVSGLQSNRIGNCVLHQAEGQAVLVAYPVNDPLNEKEVTNAITKAVALPELENLTVLAASRPASAPSDAKISKDSYWQIPLPLEKPSGKLANMLRRAKSEISLEEATGSHAWTKDHELLVEDFCKRKAASLDAGSLYLFKQLGSYLSGVPDAVLFSARDQNGRLAALAIGDFTALTTAFYMFAFRAKDAPPGTADLLLEAIGKQGGERGHTFLNLGLGISSGVSFFKRKWGACDFLPYTETSWTIKRPKKSWFSKLFGN